MNVFRIAALIALLTGPAYAQTLIQSFDEKTPQQKADDELREKFSRESQKKAPEPGVKASVDPWGNARGGDAAKTSTSKASTSKTSTSRISNSRTATSVKPPAKTGADAD
jgi:hypothetical protein